MLRSLRALCASAGGMVVLLPAAASAADLGPYAPPPQTFDTHAQPSYWSWRGFYIGGNVGYAFGDNGFVEPEGVFGGGQVGYNWQAGQFLYGIEGDFNGADIDDSGAVAGGVATTELSWISTLRGRVGFVRDKTLLYATAGVAFADIDRTFNSAALNFSESDVETGYVVGGGVEHALTDRWSTKLEYQYLNFDSGGAPFGSDDLDLHTVRLGVNYKF